MMTQHIYTKRFAVLLLVAICSVQQVWSQSDTACKALVHRAYDKFNAYGKLPAEGQMCFIDYSLHTYMRDSSKYHNSVVNVKMKASTAKTWYDNGDVEWFQDNVHSVVVIHGRNTIYLRDSDFQSPQGRQLMLQQLLQRNDTVFTTSVVEQCRTVENEGSRVREITLAMSEAVRTATQMRRIIYTIDEQDETIRAMRVEFIEKSKTATIVADFHGMRYGVSEEPFEGNVYARFFLSDSTLKAPYSDYKLVDVRAEANQNVLKHK